MNLLAQTKPNGVKVAQNACVLADNAGELAAGASEMNLDDPDTFAENAYVSIEEESLKLTDADTNPRQITRAQVDHNGDSTDADDHEDGCYVRERGGAEVLSKVFDGATAWAGAFVYSERSFWAALEVGGVQGPLKMCSSEYPYLEFPFPRYTPAGATWKILVWTTETRQFHAGYYN